MTNARPMDEDAPHDFTAALAALRERLAKLNRTVSAFLRSQTESKTRDRVATAGSRLEVTIERNLMAAVLVAMTAGLFVGVLSRRS